MKTEKSPTPQEFFEAADLLQAKAEEMRGNSRGDLQQVRDALADCKSELWDDWHSDMSECDFENHWLIMDIDKATKKLDRLIAEQGWQPIETAPKDGETKALYGCYKDGKWYTQITARGRGVGGLHVNVPTGFRSYTGATHWMPIPQPPTMQGE